jgi:type IV secretion system protein VirB10
MPENEQKHKTGIGLEEFEKDCLTEKDPQAPSSASPTAPEPEMPSYQEFEKTEDAEQEAFIPSPKKKAEDVLGSKAKSRSPQKLNKNFILVCVVSIIALLLVISQVIVPLIPGKKDKKDPSLEVAGQDFTDYSRFVKDKPVEKEAVYTPIKPKQDDDALIASLPPVSYYDNTEKTPVEAPQPTAPVKTSSVPAWPSTITDPLQGKVIAGIKGLTPTQSAYQDRSSLGSGTQGGWNNQYGHHSNMTDYASNALAHAQEIAAAQNAAALNSARTAYEKQNDQAGKTEFFENKRFDQVGSGSWIPLNAVWMGTIFEAVLLGDINTDLPGEAAAIVSKNIYSSQDGSYLLIPQNSRLIGSYNSSISYAQSRVQVGWHTLIRPDGYEVKLGNMAGTDSKGASGLKGWVNDHWGQKLLGLAMVSALSIGRLEAKNTIPGLNNEYISQVWEDGKNIIFRYAEDIINKTMNVQPTIIIRGGVKLNIVVNAHLSLPPVKDYPVTQSYTRK